MPIQWLLIVVLMLVPLSACDGAQLLDLVVSDDGYKLHRDIEFGPHRREKLDIYVPEKPNPSGAVLLFFHGGAWQKGDKNRYRFIGQAFASRGYVTVVANYRLYPQVHYPVFMADSARALAWTYRHIKEYGGNEDNIFVAGHSAGAYNAVLLALNEEFMREQGGRSSWMRGAIGLSGPYDFLPFTDPEIRAIFSRADAKDTQPINHARKGAPPLLLMSGDADHEVGLSNTQHLAARMKKLGGDVTSHVYPGVGHIGIVLALAESFHHRAPTLEHMLAFMKAHSKPK